MGLNEIEKAKYEIVWSHDSYRHGPGEHHVSDAIEALLMKPGESVADYGCGEGIAGKLFDEAGYRVIGVDITRKALSHDSNHLPFAECPLWDLPDGFPVTDWFFCVDVLEHMPTGKVKKVLDNIADHTARGGYLRVAHGPDVFGPAIIGEHLHLTQKDNYWWWAVISRVFNIKYATNSDRFSTFVVTSKIERASSKTIDAPWNLKPKHKRSIIIVGNGPSTYENNYGYRIDSHKTVVRFAYRKNQDRKSFGTKTDIIVVSLRNHSDVLNDGVTPRETWIFSRPKQVDHALSTQLFARMKKYNPKICRETWEWAYRYQELGATGYIDPRQGQPGMIPSFSQGCAAIIMTAHRFNPEKITLIGFDNLLKGTSDGYLSVHRARDGKPAHTTTHDMAIEKILVQEVGDHYGVEIAPLIP